MVIAIPIPLNNKRVLVPEQDYFEEHGCNDTEDHGEDCPLLQIRHDEDTGPCSRYNIIEVSVQVIGTGLEDKFSKDQHGKGGCKHKERQKTRSVECCEGTERVRQVFRVEKMPENKGREYNDKAHQPLGHEIRTDKGGTTDQCCRKSQALLSLHWSVLSFWSKKSFIVTGTIRKGTGWVGTVCPNPDTITIFYSTTNLVPNGAI